MSFEDIPGQSRLFLDFLRDPAALKKYYPNAVTSIADVSAFADTALSGYKTDRDQLCDILLSVNEAAGAGPETFANIETLRDRNTVAVLTGQQAGLFSGPLYTIYKALSAVRMAEELNAADTRAVPVFWAATEDHDLEEVATAHFISASGETVSVRYEPDSVANDSQVGDVVVDETVVKEISGLMERLPNTEFSAEVSEILMDAWRPGVGFGTAFIRTMTRLLRKHGVIFVDPTDERLRRLASPIFTDAIRNVDVIVSSMLDLNVELTGDGYHAQVSVDAGYFPLFWIDPQRSRRSLKKSADGLYRVKGGKTEFSVGQLLQMAAEHPEQFSPGVMLRPVVQDYLFPTACYFGGGAEVAYFAQNSVVYRCLGRPVTPVMHRQSFTVVSSKHRRAFEKLNIGLTDLFDGREVLGTRLGAAIVSPETARLFAEAEERINGEMNRLDQHLSSIDPTLSENLATRRRKIVYHIGALRKKTLSAVIRSDETFRRRLDGLFTSILPNGGLQERTLNVFTFVNQFGLSFVDWIGDAIDLDDRGHRIIDL